MINENILQVRGRATLEEPLKIGNDYNLMVSVNCDKVEEVDLQENDKFNMVYKCKPTGIVNILDDLGKKLTGITKKSLSQQLRFRIERVDSYDLIMTKTLEHFDEYYNFISKL